MRPALPCDAERLSGFSDETLYRRFMSRRPPAPALWRSLFEVDFVDHFAWVLVDPTRGPVVAEARFVRHVTDPGSAELALSVADGFQGAGAGALLVDALAIGAGAVGISRFTARIFLDNSAMRAILSRFEVVWTCDEPGVVSAAFDVPHDGKRPGKHYAGQPFTSR
jgi:RimJ/RimL family protein N-acetyltransferase